jgi:hypothetical protein
VTPKLVSGAVFSLDRTEMVALQPGERIDFTVTFMPVAREGYSDVLVLEGRDTSAFLSVGGTGIFLPVVSCSGEGGGSGGGGDLLVVSMILAALVAGRRYHRA